MATIIERDLPDNAFLQRYRHEGSYTDCYCMDVPGSITLPEYVAAFYTTSLFKVERTILAWAVDKPSTDEAAEDLAHGREAAFAAWRVEERSSHQLLLCDFLGRTRSWLMAEPQASSTRLFFGSAVVPKSRSVSGETSFGFAFHALQGFHGLYTKALMKAAHMKLVN